MCDEVMGQTLVGVTEAYAQSLSADSDLDLWHGSCVVLFIFNLTMHDKVMGWTKTGFAEAYAQSADCDLDLWPSNIISVCDISSCHDDYLCQIIY